MYVCRLATVRLALAAVMVGLRRLAALGAIHILNAAPAVEPLPRLPAPSIWNADVALSARYDATRRPSRIIARRPRGSARRSAGGRKAPAVSSRSTATEPEIQA